MLVLGVNICGDPGNRDFFGTWNPFFRSVADLPDIAKLNHVSLKAI